MYVGHSAAFPPATPAASSMAAKASAAAAKPAANAAAAAAKPVAAAGPSSNGAAARDDSASHSAAPAPRPDPAQYAAADSGADGAPKVPPFAPARARLSVAGRLAYEIWNGSSVSPTQLAARE
jgi:hypothetical protein